MTFRKSSLLLICLGFMATGAFAQQLDHVQGEILVKLWPHAQENVRTWVNTKRTLEGQPTGIKYDHRVSEIMDIHSLTFDFAEVSEEGLLNLMRRDPLVQAAQFNHFVELRQTIPDDPQFVDQWQYINTTTADADLDMELAWDIATGGLTADGDTIVACVIDDGINLNHPDMRENLWVNHAEIPDNGIDDDNNGFVDDYRGWHTGSDSDNVGQGGGHGTPVAGIVGAKGNNGIGVAGVNWDVKLMIVRGGTGVESEVLEAYSYPLTARKRYNETNGAEGAFVVSTNASWGIDDGQPADAPLWCSFYDSLGVAGILNCGATANANSNIDVNGDLPTACASDYMIAVTNMDITDNKVTSAGYGLETIDLGAFGADTWTTSLNGYNMFGGTSGATPHVTGAIALLYAAPCPTFIAIAKSDPEQGAALARDYIFNGVDPNASLEGITTTGGRLNINNSMVELMSNCGPCPPPSALAASGITDVTASISWSAIDSILTSDLEYRVAGTTDWMTMTGVTSPVELDGLMACTEYEVQIVGNCADEVSTSTILLFKTDGCCENPMTFAVTGEDDSSVSVAWSEVFAANSYNVRISVAGANVWTEVNTSDSDFTFDNLEICTEYEVQIQVVCNALTVEYSESLAAKTKGCGPCFDVAYCEPTESNNEEEWIESVEIGSLVNVSGAGDYYTFFEDSPSATFETFGNYSLTLTPGFAAQTFAEGWKIWIDFNNDGTFNGTDELVYESAVSDEVQIGTMTIPGDVNIGTARMRVAMTYNELPSDPCDHGVDWGEFEDYCVTIAEGTFVCEAPTELSISNVNQSSAFLSWVSVNGATDYDVRVKKVAGTDWTDSPSVNSTYVLAALDSDTEYEAQVKSICGAGLISEFSESVFFKTDMALNTEQITDLNALEVFPNPFQNELTVRFNFETSQSDLQLELLDQLGRTVKVQEVGTVTAGTQQVSLDVNNLTEGIYFLRMTNATGESITKRLVRIRG